MQPFAKALTEPFTKLFTTNTTNNNINNTSTPNAKPESSHARTGLEGAAGGHLHPDFVGKRLPEVRGDGEKSKQGKRQRVNEQADAHERRLLPSLGDYKGVAGATAVWTPTYEGDTTEFQANRTGTGNMGGTKFKPRNGMTPRDTLNDKPHTANPSFVRAKAAPSTLTTVSSSGHNVAPAKAPWATGVGGDGFAPGYEESHKRRKLAHGGTRVEALASRTVDLTGTNGQFSPRGGSISSSTSGQRNGTTPASASGRKINVPSLTDYFGQRESKAVDATMYHREKKAKPRRKPSGSQSSQAASVEVQDVREARPHGTREEPVEVADDSQPTPRATPPHRKRRTIEQPEASSSQRPPINLEKDMPSLHQWVVKPGSREDIVISGDIISPQKSRKPDVDHTKPTSSSSPRTLKGTPVQARQIDKTGRQSAQTHDAQASQSLAKTFKRDTSTDQAAPRLKAQLRMLAESPQHQPKPNSVDDSLGSIDELQRDSPVGTRIQTNASLLATSEAGEAQRTDQTESSPKWAPSPSDLKATQFTTSGRRAQGRAEPPHRKRKQTQQSHEPDSMPIRALYASSYVLTSGDAALLHDHTDGVLYVTLDGHSQKIVDKNQLVHISESEARTVKHSIDSYKVVLKGSGTDVSYGSICIEFLDYEGVQWFIDRMSAISQGTAKIMPIDNGQMTKVFANLTSGLHAAYLKRKDSIQGIPDAQAASREGEQEVPRQTTTGEKLRREDQSKAARPNLRKSMRDAEAVSSTDAQARIRSRFWSDSAEDNEGLRKSKRSAPALKSSSPPPIHWTEEHKPKRWAHSLEYPSTGPKRVLVDFQDLDRLDEGEFLNDNVISFALRQIEENMDPRYKKDVHFFNTFFYTALTTRNGKKVTNNYDAVKRWTKNIDIFSIPFVVVPININLHWFVAIICNLDRLRRRIAGLDGNDSDDDANVTESKTAPTDGETADPRQDEAEPINETNGMRTLSLEDQDGEGGDQRATGAGQGEDEQIVYEQTQDDDPQPASSWKAAKAPAKKKRKITPTGKKYAAETTAIITLDSFGSSHTTEVKYLKDYIIKAADDKRAMVVESSDLQGITAKGIPEQTNFCDCGVYVVGYVQQFAKDPREFIRKVLSRDMDTEADFATFNPSQKRAEIRDELLRLSEQQEIERQAAKKRKNDKKATPKSSAKPDVVATVAQDQPTKPLPATPDKSVSSIKAQKANEKTVVSAKPDAIEDHDELDMEPARALAPPVTSKSADASTKPPAIQGEPPAIEEDDDLSDDILLGTTTPDVAGTLPPVRQASQAKLDPLTTLQTILKSGPLTSGQRQHAVPDGEQGEESFKENSSDNGDDDVSPTAESTVREPQSPAEIPDSQEVRSYCRNSIRQGTHIKFSG